ncbi:hypothetical protein CDV36_009746 [Fusarium kuroshium]|uniref:Uncharacterized protein n=3 Tax=Fusarium solani species complex TaxID=232080 RepID=A0A3M2RZ99_9HYPO|nr:hypothetical protein CDV36_009746 [Fusarium kuroshium]RSL54375.1 hypothetical protein CEP51_014724 [Fusarium floridanum]RSL98078.1 hypothetical protein CDV31_012773 [Fusarium ambrosium]
MGFIHNYGSMETAAPSLEDLHRREDGKLTVTRAPDEICGFISERPGAAFGCSIGDHCYFFPPASQQTPQHNRVVCCGEGVCEWWSTCYNFEEYWTSRKCTDGCEVDNNILKCTGTAYPYCHTVSWEGNTIDYSCGDVDITTTMSVALTYSGQKNREFLTLDDEQVSALFQGLDGTAMATETGVIATKSSSGSGPAATEAKDSGGGGSGTNTGAIVGGVVGGVGAIALFAVAGLLFLRMRRKKKSQDVSPPEYEPTPSNDNSNNSNKEVLQPGAAPYSDTPTNGAAAIYEAEVKDKPQELANNEPKKEPVELA